MWWSGQITLQRLQSSICNLRKQAADVWCREHAVINSRHVDPPQSVSFYQPRFDTLYCADEAVVCQEAVDGVPRAGGWSDRTSCGDKALLSVFVHAAAEPSRLVTYDNATVGAAAVRQLHKRARHGRSPARCGLSQYLPTILLFARSLFFLSRHLSRRCLGVNSVQRWPPSSSLRLTK